MKNYEDLNDYEIIYMIGENDDSAKELMFKKYEPVIYKEANKLVNYSKKIGLEFDDLIQEGYLALAKSFEQYNPDKNILFYTYVLSAIKKRMLNLMRANSTNKNALLNNSLSLDLDVYEHNGSLFSIIEDTTTNKPLEELEEKEYMNYIKKQLFSFPILEACVFELRMNGFKYKEIAELLSISKVYINRVITRIRKNFYLLIEN